MQSTNTRRISLALERVVCKTDLLRRKASKAGWACFSISSDELSLTLRPCSYSIAKLRDVKSNRRQIVSAKQPACGYAMNWIEANKHHFEKQVYFPAAVEVEVTDAKYAGLIENCFNRNTMFVSDYDGQVVSRPFTVLT